MSTNTIPNDGWRPLEDMPDDLSILFIEGYCQVPWMQQKFVTGGKVQDVGPFSGCKTFRVWCTEDPPQDEASPDAFGMDRCIQEIECGKYHAIVVVDLSYNEQEFEELLGHSIQAFVSNGGVVAFPSSESTLVRTLQNLFDVTWERSSYYRTTWGPCKENELLINYNFGNGNFSRRIISEYSVKGNTLRGVPPHERCFGVSSKSKTQSLVPMMDGRDVGRHDENEDEDYDVIVAMHEYGKGTIAYFGDVNGQDETIRLVAGFVQSRSPKLPVDCFAGLGDEAFELVKAIKEKGNTAFKEANLEEALAQYNNALDIFGSKLGSHGPQREELVNLYSNISLIQWKKGRWLDSESAASKALDIDGDHRKSLFRRAKARVKISRDKKGGDIARLKGAEKDLVDCCEFGDDWYETSRNLLLNIEAELQRLKKKEKGSFLAGFGKAL